MNWTSWRRRWWLLWIVVSVVGPLLAIVVRELHLALHPHGP